MSQNGNEDRNAGGNENDDDQERRKKENEEEEGMERKREESAVGGEVKSTAIVKYSAVEAPATFTRLQCNTNLNLPPSNWLSSSAESYGLRATSFSHKSGFSSFQMAHMFPDCVGEVDVVSDAENVKKLLKIPYSHGPVSMMVHRIENTLLIDEFDVHKYLLREAECQWEWFKKFFENVMQSNAKNKVVRHRDNSRNALQQKSLVSKFLYHSLVVADPSKQKLEKSELQEVDPSASIPLPYKGDSLDPPLPDPTLEEELPDPSCNHKFSRNVIWTFEDIQMLLGTDLPIFGGGTHPCISLRLRDMTKPINVLTGMDYWLDNLMCNVPEVVMCYHLNGIVQKYELIKTEDLPNLENSKFSPKVVRDIAQNILSFLKANATKAGHTYWLFKGKDDDVVKLYDLTSLCTGVMDDKGQTPFTVPVAMLLYRVARNMKNTSDESRQAATIRMLLNNCLSLLSPEKYPEIVTSAHYMLSDLYIPANINPASPELPSSVDAFQEETWEDKPRAEDENDAIKSLSVANISEIHMEEPELISPPPPLGTDVEGRCIDGINHVIKGLRTLKYLNDEKESPEAKEQEPEMAKPFQTIPMPYQPLDEKEDEKRGRKKSKKKKKEVAKAEEGRSLLCKPKAEEGRSLLCKPKAEEGRSLLCKPKAEEGRSLLCKPKAEAIPTWRPPTPKNTSSWNLHLKTLLFEKMCLIYATLLERTYAEGKFGATLRHVGMVLRARRALKTLRTDFGSDDGESYLLGRAGDAFFMVVQNSKKMEELDKEYTTLAEFDREALEELKKEGVEFSLEEVFPKKLENVEELLLAGCRCYQKALEFGGSNENLLRRLGNIENELGVFYMNRAAEIFQQELVTKEDVEGLVYKELFQKSFQHLESGIKAFNSVKDEANLALLYSNTGRLMRVQAHFLSLTEADKKELETQERAFYKKSIFYHQKALQVLGERKYNPVIWDSVNWELSTALFSMATLLQDYPPLGKAKEEAEKEVTETLHKALKNCDVETPGARQPVYQYRSAIIHHRLASLYHKSYRSSAEDENKKKKVYQLCKLHYEKSAKLLLLLENSSEYLRVQLERVAFAEYLAEGSTSTAAKIKHHEYALELLLEAEPVLKMISERDMTFYEQDEGKTERREDSEKEGETEKKSELENEMVLLNFYEQRLQFNLLSLTKLHMNRNDGKKGSVNLAETYKKLYATSLKAKCSKDNPMESARSLLSVSSEISTGFKSVSVAS